MTGSARRRLLPRQAPQPVGDRSSIATGLTVASSPVSLRAGRDLSFPATGPTASSSPVSLRTALLRVPQLIEQRRNVCSGVDNKFCVGVRLHSNVSGAHTPAKKRHRRVARSKDIAANSPPGAWSDGRQTPVNSVDVNHCVRVHRSLLSEDEERLCHHCPHRSRQARYRHPLDASRRGGRVRALWRGDIRVSCVRQGLCS